jgi:hypothetical protein
LFVVAVVPRVVWRRRTLAQIGLVVDAFQSWLSLHFPGMRGPQLARDIAFYDEMSKLQDVAGAQAGVRVQWENRVSGLLHKSYSIVNRACVIHLSVASTPPIVM